MALCVAQNQHKALTLNITLIPQRALAHSAKNLPLKLTLLLHVQEESCAHVAFTSQQEIKVSCR